MVHSVICDSSRSVAGRASICRNSINGVFCASQTCVVRAVRTLRPFSRADMIELTIKLGFAISCREAVGIARCAQRTVPIVAIPVCGLQKRDACATSGSRAAVSTSCVERAIQYRVSAVLLSIRRYSANTQVSLTPPPCDEFTTRLPSFSATRVRPPGTICTVLPLSTKGRRSMWRGATPLCT